MKIIRISTFLDFGGVEKRLTNVASVDDENEWIFCAINKGGQAEKEIQAKNKSVFCLNLPYKIPNLKTVYALSKFLKNQAPNVVHTSGAEANFHGVLAAKLAGVPKIIAEEIGVPSQGFLSKIILTAIYKVADYVVGNSLPVLKYLKENNGVSNKKLRLVPNPIIFRQLGERNTTAATFNIVSVSRLEKVKNIEAVINVVKKLTDEGFAVRYTIVGSGIIEQELKAQVKTLNLGNAIIFSGFVSDPYPSLLKADLYIINSFTEGFSNSLLEAMYSGTPSISSKSGSAEEIIEHGVNGWLVDVDNEEKLYALIKQVISLDTMEREKIGLNSKRTAENKYSLSNHVSKLLEIYK
jgi:glycosyltransferase involved in cell wall biosynthesis